MYLIKRFELFSEVTSLVPLYQINIEKYIYGGCLTLIGFCCVYVCVTIILYGIREWDLFRSFSERVKREITFYKVHRCK